MELGEGILTLRCAEGKLIRDTEFFGAMSPYCTITHKKSKFKTKVAHEQGKTPKWKDEFQINVTDAHEEVHLRVWDQDMTSSDAVGYAKIKMSSLIINCGVEDDFDVTY